MEPLQGPVRPRVRPGLRAEHDSTIASLRAENWANLNATERRIESCVLSGIECLRSGAFAESVSSFDEAQALAGGSKYLWQRGVALFYMDRFDEAIRDLEANAARYETTFDSPATEERLLAAAARRRWTGIAHDDHHEEEEEETRPVMRLCRDLFKGRARPADMAALVGDPDKPDIMRRLLFAHFYLGLYFDSSQNHEAAARAHMLLAKARADLEPPHRRNTDLLLALPDLHFRARKWDLDQVHPDVLARAQSFSYD